MYEPTGNTFLRNLLLIDALTCAGMGIALVIAAAWLSKLLAIPATLLIVAGVTLLPVAAFMAFVGTRKRIAPFGVILIVAGNIAWVAASVGLMAGPWIQPNVIGQVFIGVQAATVLVLAVLEYSGLRQHAANACA